MSPGLVCTCSSQALLSLPISLYVYTYISYQGQGPSSGAVRALQAIDLEPLTAGAIFRRQKNPKETCGLRSRVTAPHKGAGIPADKIP